MVTHDLIQGSDAWHQFRLENFGASEAAAMLGLSSKVKRTELLHMKFTCLPKEFSEWVQTNILDYGHEVEALARPIVEQMIDNDLYPVTCSLGKLSASCDGLTMSEDTAFEHKQWNAALAAAVITGELPEEYMPQCQQILLVTKAKSVIFAVSDGTVENFVSLEIFPDQAWFDRIKAGWAQFEIDFANYVPVEFAEKPQAEAILELPALYLHAKGEITSSNMEAFGTALAASLAAARATVYVTDQDFSNADAQAKTYRETCKKLMLAKEAMLSQTVTIGEAARMIDVWHEDLRVTALQLEKDSEKNKTAKKLAIITDAKNEFMEYATALQDGIPEVRLNCTVPNFAESIKSKRLFSAMYDAVQTDLANAKIAVNKVAQDLRANLDWHKGNAEFAFLFNDLQTIAYKPADDFELLVFSRIAEHKKREAEKLEAERTHIAAEEKTKAEAKAKADADAQAAIERAEIQRQQSEIADKAAEQERKAKAEQALANAELKAAQDKLNAEQAMFVAKIKADEEASKALMDDQVKAQTAPAVAVKMPIGAMARPSSDALADVIAKSYNVPKMTAIRWLRLADFATLEGALAA